MLLSGLWLPITLKFTILLAGGWTRWAPSILSTLNFEDPMNMTFLFPSERKVPSDRRHNVSCQWWLQKERLGSSKAPGSNGKTSTGDIWLDSSWSMGERAGDVDRDSKSVKVITLLFLSLWSYWLPEICQADGSVRRTHSGKTPKQSMSVYGIFSYEIKYYICDDRNSSRCPLRNVM